MHGILEKQRVDQAKKYLQFGNESVSEISQICGYSETDISPKYSRNTPASPRPNTEARYQIANICWIIKKAREFQKHLLLLY